MPINSDINTLNKTQLAAKHIKFAADKTGVDFDYLLQTAKRESAFDPNAKAKTSSATGLFQFVRQTWYETLHDFGDKHGYGNFSQSIERDKNGRYYVPNEQAKSAVLNLRKDPKAASLMAAEFSIQNTQYLQNEIGRSPKASELYMAHFMGRGAAAKLINLQQSAPDIKADDVFPVHAAANKPIFYDKGRARSIDQVYDNLAKHHVKLAKTKGLDPERIENVAQLVPFLPSNDGFFSNLFGEQRPNQQAIRPIAFTGMGANTPVRNASALSQKTLNSKSLSPMNALLVAQMVGQQPQQVSDSPKPLPEVSPSLYDNASIAKGRNFFSVAGK
ncbi:MAG: transglycosylase SLT domain-containing protein [Alphaproteobacteria bacterium]|nr:transglycosylase SLT domain-containing protein [Alphaproteobacteria bacterium]